MKWSKKISVYIFLGILFLSVVSAEVIIVEASVGKPQIMSVGQEITPGEAILSIGIKNVGEAKGSFRLSAVDGENKFRLYDDWYGTINPGETKNLELKLVGDSEFYGKINYKIILEETISQERSIYEDSFLIAQKTIEDKGVKDLGISGIEHNFNTKPFSQLFIIYIIIPLIILIGIGFYIKVLKSKHQS